MRLTRRGWAVVGVILAAVALALLFGPRSLNAVAAPLVAALGFGAWQVSRAGEADVSLEAVPAGFPGERRSLTISLDGSGVAAVEAPLPEGLGGGRISRTVTLPGTIESGLDLAARGRYDFTDLTVHQRDALGLVEVTSRPEPPERVIVYPTVYDVGNDRRLERLFADVAPPERQEFDRLREYTPGDPLRRVHWKSSAKRDDYLVMEFAPTRRNETVAIAADATTGAADDVASAAGTIVVAAVAAGLGIELMVPGGHLPAGQGRTHRANALRLLATTGPGSVPTGEHGDADVSIHADADATTIRLGGSELDYATLVAGRRQERARPEVVA